MSNLFCCISFFFLGGAVFFQLLSCFELGVFWELFLKYFVIYWKEIW